jgi:hypothetical protein
VRLRRLREPRYLVGLVIGVAYFYWILGGSRSRGGIGQMMASASGGRMALEFGVVTMLLLVTAVAWASPISRGPALGFTRADVQFLFTAPIARRRLIRYRVWRSQIGILWSSAFLTLIVRPTSLGQVATVFLGVALLMTIVNIHMMGASLNRGRGAPGAAGLARRWAPRVLVAAVFVVLGTTLAAQWTDLQEAFTRGEVRATIEQITATGPAGVVLWPFRALVRPAFAESPMAFLAALPWALALLGLNYFWVLGTDVPFEEGSAELSERIAELRRRGPSAWRRPRVRATVPTPFELSFDGRPETAILWKNLILMGRFLSWTLLVRLALVIVMLSVVLPRAARTGNTANVLTTLCLFVAGFALLLGPQMMRGDLRHDLASIGVLKTWPVRGAALVRGEILAPAIVLTAIVYLALIAAAVLSTGSSFAIATNRWTLLLAALLVAPGIVLIQLLMQNALAVMFPSLVSIGTRQQGIDVTGQRMLLMLGALLGLAVALVPPAIVVAVAALGLYMVAGRAPVILPGALAAATLIAEAFLASEAVGAIFDRTDVSAVDPAEGFIDS